MYGRYSSMYARLVAALNEEEVLADSRERYLPCPSELNFLVVDS
jgi:hypothetical protein